MDFADDVAYSVHDLEDAVHAGHVDLAILAAAATPGDPDGVLAIAADYDREASEAELRAALQRLVALPFWPRWYAGTLRDQATLKNLTSRLIGRFCTAAESATRAVHGSGLTRYAADLEVPSEQRVEVAVLKAVANRYVMQRPESLAAHARQRELLLELAAALRRSGPVAPGAGPRPSYEQAPDDAAPAARARGPDRQPDRHQRRGVAPAALHVMDRDSERAHRGRARRPPPLVVELVDLPRHWWSSLSRPSAREHESRQARAVRPRCREVEPVAAGGGLLVGDGRPGRLPAGDAADAAAGVGRRAGVVQPGDRRAVVGVARRRPHVEQLLERELAVEDVAADQAVLVLHLVRAR